MRRLFIAALASITFHTSLAQQDCPCSHQCSCIVSGSVVDIETGEPLSFANIKILASNTGVSADEKGFFQLTKICECDLQIEISYTGYKAKTIAVHSDHAEFLKVFLAQDAKLLESVIVLGKNKSAAFESQNIQNINADKIEATAGSSLGESLMGISGVNMLQTGGNIAKPVIQGLNSNRILILNNGIRYEGQQWGAEHAPAIDPLIADRMEVIKGSASVKYGSGALGGVILVLPAPLPSEKEISGKVILAGQSNGGVLTSSAMVESAMEKNWAWRVQGTFKKGGDLNTPEYHLTNTGMEEYNFSTAIGKKYDHSDHELFVSYFNTELGILKTVGLINSLEDFVNAVNSELPPGTEDFSYQINAPKQTSNHSLIKLKSNWDLGENNLKLQYGFQLNNRREFDIRRGNLVNIPSMDLQLSTHNLDLDFEINTFGRHQLNIGSNVIYQQNKNIPGTQTIPFIPNYNSVSGGLFAIDRYKLNKFTLEFGGRMDYQAFDVAGRDYKNEIFLSNYNFLNFSGLAGFRFTPDQRNIFIVNISTGWRPPHVAELYSYGTHQSAAAIEYGFLLDDNNEIIDASNVGLKSEGSIKFVGTYEFHGDKFHFDASAYYQSINNFFYLKSSGVTNSVRGTMPTFRYRQTRALFTGLDMDFQYDMTRYLSLNMLYSYLYARDLSNEDYFLYIPANRLNAGITWHMENVEKLDHIDVFVKGNYTFEQKYSPITIDINAPDLSFPENGGNYDFITTPPSYFLLEAGVSLHKVWEKNSLELKLSGENLLNTTYKNNTNRLKYYTYDKGQNLKMGIIYHF